MTESESVEARWETHHEAGNRYLSQGDAVKAEQAIIAAIREATLLGPESIQLATSLSDLARLKYRQRDLAQAEALFRQSLAVRERATSPDDLSLVPTLNSLAALHYARGDYAHAEPLYRRALHINEKHLGAKHPDVAVTLNHLARLYFRRDDHAAAAPLLMRLLAIKEETVGSDHPEVAAILTSLAKVRSALGDHRTAEQLARRAVAIRERQHRPGDTAIAASLEALADVLAGSGQHVEAGALRGRALAIREETLGSEHPTVVAARAALAGNRSSSRTDDDDQLAIVHGSSLAADAAPIDLGPGDLRARSGVSSDVGPAVRHTDLPPGDPGPMPTTKSVSLPWIEPPTSPALRRRTPLFMPARAGAASPRARRGTGPMGVGSGRAAERNVGGEPPRPRRRRSGHRASAPPTSDRSRSAPRRSARRVALAMFVVAAVGGWGWWVRSPRQMSRVLDSLTRSRATGDASGAVAPTETVAAPAPAATPDSLAPLLQRHDSIALERHDSVTLGRHDSVAAGADSLAPVGGVGGADSPPRPTSPRADSTAPTATPSKQTPRRAASAPRHSAAALPQVDIHRITETIGKSARARIDSLGRTTIATPAPFGKPKH
jgi:tetratricopeptide (TPR) repeat protein